MSFAVAVVQSHTLSILKTCYIASQQRLVAHRTSSFMQGMCTRVADVGAPSVAPRRCDNVNVRFGRAESFCCVV